MCFSIKVSNNSRQLSLLFNAEFSENDAADLQNLFKIQSEMKRKRFDELMGASKSEKPLGPFRLPKSDSRIMPGYFANVIVVENGKRIFKPMRFQVRPADSDYEIEGIYNARLDSLTTKKTWRPLFMRKHGLVPFVGFYEWVLAVPDDNTGLFGHLNDDGKKHLKENTDPKNTLIHFFPENREIMWAPCIWDEWTSEGGELSFKSFAIVTDEPPREVEIMGHDRCPIFIKEEYIEEWLNPQSSNSSEILEILKSREKIKYSYKWIS